MTSTFVTVRPASRHGLRLNAVVRYETMMYLTLKLGLEVFKFCKMSAEEALNRLLASTAVQLNRCTIYHRNKVQRSSHVVFPT